MREAPNEIDGRVIPFPGAAAVPRSGGNALVETYEEARQASFRLCMPTIGDKLSPLNRRINEADALELVDAADEIIRGSYARLAIRETARYEEAYNRLVEAPGRFTVGVLNTDSRLDELRAERDKAVASHLKVRERLARIRRVEALAERTVAETEQPAITQKRRSGAV